MYCTARLRFLDTANISCQSMNVFVYGPSGVTQWRSVSYGTSADLLLRPQAKTLSIVQCSKQYVVEVRRYIEIIATYRIVSYRWQMKYQPFFDLAHGVGAQSTLGGTTFLPEKYVWKINKIPEFYMILVRKICKYPNFYNISPKN